MVTVEVSRETELSQSVELYLGNTAEMSGPLLVMLGDKFHV